MFPLFSSLIRRYAPRGALLVALLAIIAIFAGAAAFSVAEHVSYGLALYWAVTTASTVGYGDVVPHNVVGRVVAVMMMVTAIPLLGALFSLMAAGAIELRMRRLLGMERIPDMKDHTVILGLQGETRIVMEELRKKKERFVLVADVDRDAVGEDALLIQGDPSDERTLRRARVDVAQHILITLGSDGEVLEAAIAARQLAPGVPIVVSTRSAKVARALAELGITRTLSADEWIGHALAKSLDAPHGAELLKRLLDSNNYRIAEVGVEASWVGRKLSEVRGLSREVVLGVVSGADTLVGVRQDPTVDQGSKLLVLQPVEDA